MKQELPHRIIFRPDPFEMFEDWYDHAKHSEPNDPNAMSLATASADGTPNVRMVLCKSFDRTGFRFYTNTESAKGAELAANPRAALCFHWKSLHRQVRIQGGVTKLSEADDDAYFKQRHRETQIGAWSSSQSRPLDNIVHLTQNVYSMQAKYEGQPVPRPPHWGGYHVTPDSIEFWVERPHRLHERMVYARNGNDWVQQRLYP